MLTFVILNLLIDIFQKPTMEYNQQEKRTLLSKFKSFILECRRVFTITRKPSKEELKIIVKVSGIGILIIGFLGFIIQILWQVIK